MSRPQQDHLADGSAPAIPHSRPAVGPDAVRAVLAALESGRLAQGAEVAALERDLAGGLGAGLEVVAVSSGTAALYLALAALGAGPGRRVIIPSYACPSLYAAVAHTGAEPACADAGADAVVLTPETVAPLVGPDVAAIVAPHLFGFEADIAGLKQWGIPVVEDCAQALGAAGASGKPLGTQGDLAVFSFYATKLLPAGEGGACAARDPEWIRRVRQWRQCDEQPLHPRAFNFKLSDLAAALARAQFRSLPAALARRAELAARYDGVLAAASFRRRSARPQPVCFRYLVEAPGPLEPILAACRDAGLACRRPVWDPLHRTLGGVCPAAEDRHARLLSVPLYPSLTDAEADRILEVLAPRLARSPGR
jgi:perosamine synthetase